MVFSRTIAVFSTVVIGYLLRPACNTAAPIPQLDGGVGYSRLRAAGKFISLRPLTGFSGTVIAVDSGSVTLRGLEVEASGAKRTDFAESDLVCQLQRAGKDPITLRFQGWEVRCDRYRVTRELLVVTLLDHQEVTVRTSELPPRRFPVSDFLRSGVARDNTELQGPHLLSDVKTGDWIGASVHGLVERETCTAIEIFRRPGGTVPYPSYATDAVKARIDRHNAHQAYEDRGIPIPPQHRSDAAIAKIGEQFDEVVRAAGIPRVRR